MVQDLGPGKLSPGQLGPLTVGPRVQICLEPNILCVYLALQPLSYQTVKESRVFHTLCKKAALGKQCLSCIFPPHGAWKFLYFLLAQKVKSPPFGAIRVCRNIWSTKSWWMWVGQMIGSSSQASELWFYHMSWHRNGRGGQTTMKEEGRLLSFVIEWV